MTYVDIIKHDPFTIEWTPTLFDMVYETHKIKIDIDYTTTISEMHSLIKEKARAFMVNNFEEIEVCLPAINNNTVNFTKCEYDGADEPTTISYTVFLINQRSSTKPMSVYENGQHKFNEMSSFSAQLMLTQCILHHTPLSSIPGEYLYDDYYSLGSVLNVIIPRPFNCDELSEHIMHQIPPNCILVKYFANCSSFELILLYIPDMIPELKSAVDKLQSLPNYLVKLDDANEVPF